MAQAKLSAKPRRLYRALSLTSERKLLRLERAAMREHEQTLIGREILRVCGSGGDPQRWLKSKRFASLLAQARG